MATKGLSKKDDMPQLYEYLIKYTEQIEKCGGQFDFDDKKVQKFLRQKDIYTERYRKDKLKKIKKHKWYLLFEQNKKSNKSGKDTAHHLLRHIRNAIAHANIEKNIKKNNRKTNQVYTLKDFNSNTGGQTMIGVIESKLLWELIDLLIGTKM